MAPPIYVKGGVWTNVEDQILKAAVSKYGLTQWARVASLLPKKTAKQAKARWNEYLNPTINRTEWTKEDDQKLLNMAKLLPNQWRSIASVVGRTATHCVERYQKLLDDALKEGGESEEDDDLKLSGPGIETIPALGSAYESLASRPDLEDMDEDEREMLSEARARLANTQGKKAKRKDRERMLEESKRVALLQKRRELKAAGINISLILRNKKRRKEFDYNADIPHERQPPPGLYDTAQEDQTNESERAKFQKEVNVKGISMKEVDEKHSKKKKEDTDKEAKRLRSQIQAAAKGASELAEFQAAKRRKLHLPAPGEAEGEDADSKILQTLKELLAGQEEVSAFAPGQATPIRSESPAQPKEKVAKSGLRKLAATLRSMFAELPAPKNPPAPPMLFAVEDDTGETGFAATEEAEVVSLANEETVPHTSQVIQRGLKVPNPELLVLPDSLQGVELEIAKEFGALIRSDYAEFEDETYKAAAPAPVDAKALRGVEHAIAEELAKGEAPKVELPKVELPSDEANVDAAYDLLYELDAAATASDTRLYEHDGYAESEERIDEIKSKIAEHAELLSAATIEEKLLSDIAQSEQVAIQMRSARLHELAEDVRAAVARAHRVM